MQYLYKVCRGLNSTDAGFFDVVLGNPPYIKEYTDKSAFKDIRKSKYYQGKMDLWYLFACNSIDLLAYNGLLCFIATNNWTTSSGASKMRNKIVAETKIISLLDFGNLMIFESASIQTMVMLFKKNKLDNNYHFDFRKLEGHTALTDAQHLIMKNEKANTAYLKPTVTREKLNNKFLTFTTNKWEAILSKMLAVDHFKFDENDISQGIVIPQDFLNKKNNEKLGSKYVVGESIFVLTENVKNNLRLTESELEIVKPYFQSENFHNYYTDTTNKLWIIYTNSEFKNLKKISSYPNLKVHLDKFNKIITSDNKPYGLHRAREEKIFNGEKIIVKRKCVDKPQFSYSNGAVYVSATFNIIKTSKTSQKYLTGLLNSRLIAFWLKNKGKMQGNNFQLDKEPLMNIPIYIPTESQCNQIEKLVEEIIMLKSKGHDSSTLEEKIDIMVYDFYGLEPSHLDIV